MKKQIMGLVVGLFLLASISALDYSSVENADAYIKIAKQAYYDCEPLKNDCSALAEEWTRAVEFRKQVFSSLMDSIHISGGCAEYRDNWGIEPNFFLCKYNSVEEEKVSDTKIIKLESKSKVGFWEWIFGGIVMFSQEGCWDNEYYNGVSYCYDDGQAGTQPLQAYGVKNMRENPGAYREYLINRGYDVEHWIR